jgi:hypothetical protein
MNNLLIALLNKLCHNMDCYGEKSIQELTLSQQAYEELKQFGQWHDDNRLKLQVGGFGLEIPVFDYINNEILPQIEAGKLLVNGYTFNIKIKE